VLGRHAPDEIYPRVAAWLDAHRPARAGARRTRGAAAGLRRPRRAPGSRRLHG